jgi:hypothetical protein
MSADSFTETVSTGWFSRIGDSIKGILLGLVMIVAAFPVLFINEGCAVKTRKTLDQGNKEFVHVDPTAIDNANEGKLLHLTGQAVSPSTLEDPQFQVKTEALKLKRDVEMYQWKESQSTETNKKLGGSEEKTTTYTYDKVWEKGRIDSSGFKKASEHSNPTPSVTPQVWTANPITVGAFTLNKGLISQINEFTPVSIEPNKNIKPTTEGLPNLQQFNGQYYSGKNPSNPQIGDLRISLLKVNNATEVSIIAQQHGSTFEPFTGKSGSTIEMLQIGNHTAAAMFADAQKSNQIRTWVVRVVGFLLMLIGFNLLFKPFSIIADVLPIAGTIVGVGTGIVAFLLSAPLSLLTIASAWIFYRPLIGIPLFIAAGVGIFFLIKKIRAYKKAQG